MPEDFKRMYGSTRIILDATEVRWVLASYSYCTFSIVVAGVRYVQ
jgi:hypothetical protein